jgi:hypothetical protein
LKFEQLVLATAVWFCELSPVFAGTALPVCPARIDSEQSVKPSILDWEMTQADTTHYLSGIGMYEGKIADRVQLAPSGEMRKGASALTTWTFSGPISPINVACHYAGTSIILSQPLPAKVTSCSIASDRKTGRVDAASLRCKP